MEPVAQQTSPAAKAWLKYKRIGQTYLDKTVIYPNERWIAFFVSIFLYCIRVYFIQGFYIVSYALGIYLLNLVIGFLSPAFDPEEQEDGDGPMLPTAGEDGEFRPFSRKLPEFKFWCSGMRATWISVFCTFFEIFDLPVFWPVLLIYFILLVFVTMKDRLKHMIRYNYVPWSAGKRTYREMTKTDIHAGGTPPKDNK